MKYRMVIAYEGSAFSGWQIQPNAPSIQEELEKAIATLLGHHTRVIGSGRTDAGVHAVGQVAHFMTENAIDIERFHRSLNGLLPHTIRVMLFEEAPEDFHAQYSAIAKTYHYHLHLDRIEDPFRRPYHLQVFRSIDRELLKEAAQQFVGTHDFSSFANEAHSGAAAKNPVRTLHRLDVIEEGPSAIRLEFEGNGFLYKMVRNIVGMLLEVSTGKREIGDIVKLFAAKDRRLAGRAASPKGLFLMQVDYPNFSSGIAVKSGYRTTPCAR